MRTMRVAISPVKMHWQVYLAASFMFYEALLTIFFQIRDIASRGGPRTLDVTVRRENGEAETYSLDSMTKRRCHRLMQDLRDFMPVDGQRAGYRSRRGTVIYFSFNRDLL